MLRVYVSVPYAFSQRMHQFLTRTFRVRIKSWSICSACFEGTLSFHTYVRSVHASVPEAYAQFKHQFLTRMFGERISVLMLTTLQSQLSFLLSAYSPIALNFRTNIKLYKVLLLSFIVHRPECYRASCATVPLKTVLAGMTPPCPWYGRESPHVMSESLSCLNRTWHSEITKG